MASTERNTNRASYADEDLLTPAAAAEIAARSVRTIRRAYTAGALPAFRDGGGRGVRIRYGDLRAWMMCEPVVVGPVGAPSSPASHLLSAIAPPTVRSSSALSENLALLRAAREVRQRRERAGPSVRRAGSRASSSSA